MGLIYLLGLIVAMLSIGLAFATIKTLCETFYLTLKAIFICCNCNDQETDPDYV